MRASPTCLSVSCVVFVFMCVCVCVCGRQAVSKVQRLNGLRAANGPYGLASMTPSRLHSRHSSGWRLNAIATAVRPFCRRRAVRFVIVVVVDVAVMMLAPHWRRQRARTGRNCGSCGGKFEQLIVFAALSQMPETAGRSHGSLRSLNAAAAIAQRSIGTGCQRRWRRRRRRTRP